MNNISDIKISLVPINENERANFINALQAAFTVAVVKEFGESAGEVIPKEDIEKSMDAPGAETYHIVLDGQIVGGTVIVIHPSTQHNSLDLLFVNPNGHGRGVGLAAWKSIEQLHPETEIWETHTPYFEKRNIHFYVNKCGFNIVEFYNPRHLDPHTPREDIAGAEYFFRFEKDMRRR
ncbi:GNAT family N-acetyltransferase [Desulfosporosinus sp. PR]|uniref:GNAT family N-acetyltransferase n=1 Tax=Candidatus Desulfosporosinus nitrosoreducens TaxID=3401928 RepID=UPI0027F6E835|nr:GNAT family N-acetyltransferase [Desulfosporosinus sp. PR]MDQ7096622.1 GNAT family N-acetyltransferase [Desulfosporosinus sp. PR]